MFKLAHAHTGVNAPHLNERTCMHWYGVSLCITRYVTGFLGHAHPLVQTFSLISSASGFLKLPVATGIICLPKKNGTKNGDIFCSDENYYASQCRYTCHEGYGFTNVSWENNTCVNDGGFDHFGMWSMPTAKCWRE